MPHGAEGTPGNFAWMDGIEANKLDKSEASSTYVLGESSRARYGSPPIASAMDPSTLLAPSGVKLTSIVTYVGGNNEVVEPSVYYNPNGWNGFEFWMAAGPYENSSNTVENPSIWCSHDGQNWGVPAGGTNPVAGPPGAGNYDDPHLFELNGTMYLTFNWSSGADKVMLSSSANGVTWTTPVAIVTGAGGLHDLMSPHVEYQAGIWHMWVISMVGGAPNLLQHRTASAINGPWSAPTTCTAPVPSGLDMWEFEVRRVGSEWWMLQTIVVTGQTASGGRLYLRTSQDGITWNLAAQPVLVADPSGGSTRFDANFIYKASFVPMLDGRIAIWYSAGSGGTLRWSIGYTVATKRATQNPVLSAQWYAPPCSVTTKLLAQGTTMFCPVYFDRPTSLAAIGLEVTTAGSAGSVVSLGWYYDNGYGQPGKLLIDAGQIDGTSVSIQTKTAAVIVGPGVMWMAALSLGSPATQPTVRAAGSPIVPIGTSSALASANAIAGYSQTGRTVLDPTAAVSSGTSNPARLIYQAT